MKKIKKNTIIFSLMVAFIGLVCLSCISIYFGSNPLNRHNSYQRGLVSVFPQGWAFFTKNSREPRMYIFKVLNDQLNAIEVRNFSQYNCWGMNRSNRLVSLQVHNIFTKINSTDSSNKIFTAKSIDGVRSQLKVSDLSFFNIDISDHTAPDFNGKYVIVSQKMLPWSLISRNPDYASKFIAYPINVIHHD